MAVLRAVGLFLLLGLLAGHAARAQSSTYSDAEQQDSTGLQAKTYSIPEICVGSDAMYLIAALNKCNITAAGSPNQPVDMSFLLPDDAATADFDLFISLRTTVGGVTMSLKYQANINATEDGADPVTLYSTIVRDPSQYGMLTVTRESLQPGLYYLHIETSSPTSRFTVRIFTPSKPMTMHADDVAAIKQLYHQCCPQQGDTCQLCLQLRNAIATNRAPEADLCNVVPNMCNTDGHLFRLVLRPDLVGDLKPLQCAAGALPLAPISKLKYLQFLDLSNQGLGGDVASITAAFAPLELLDTIWLNNNTISGELSCDLIQQNPVKVLRARRNQISGSIPDCYMASQTLLTLDLTRNSLNGSIPTITPDPVTGSIPLLNLYLRNQSGDVGLSGSLPSNLVNASQLVILDIIDNSIEGPIPELPATLEVAYLDNNLLSGSFPATSSLANITFFSASNNNLTGPIPKGIFAAEFIQAIDLSNNSITGTLDDIPWKQIMDQLTWIDLSNNQLTGTVPALPFEDPTSTFQVTSFLFGGNKITGNLDQFVSVLSPPDNETNPGGTPIPTNTIIRLDLSNNLLTGTVPPALSYISMFYGYLDGWVNQGIPPFLDLHNNELSGAFPLWIYPAIAQAIDIPEAAPLVDLSGNQLTCPPPGSISTTIALFQPVMQLSCYDAATGDEVDVLEALNGTTGDHSTGGASLTGSRVSSASTGSSSAPSSSHSSSSDGKSGLGAGVIAGIAIGCIVGAAIIATLIAVAAVQLRKKKKQRAYRDMDDPQAGKTALPRLPQSTFVGPESNIV